MRMTFAPLALVSAFLVVSPAASAQPTPAPRVHSVWAQKPLYVTDGQTGVQYQVAPGAGAATMNWKDGTRDGFFHASAIPTSPMPVVLNYEFILVAISSANSSYIEGLWDIYRNSALVCTGCVGRAYGIDQTPGSYFKLYVGDSTSYAEKWHFSAYITNRFDY